MFKIKKAVYIYYIIASAFIIIVGLASKHYQLFIFLFMYLADLIFINFYMEKMINSRLYLSLEKFYKNKRKAIKYLFSISNYLLLVILNLVFVFSKLTTLSAIIYIVLQIILFFTLHFIAVPALKSIKANQ